MGLVLMGGECAEDEDNSPVRVIFFCDGGLCRGGRCSSPEVLLSSAKLRLAK